MWKNSSIYEFCGDDCRSLCTCRLNVFWENIWCKMENNVEKYDVLACWSYVVFDVHVLSMLWCVCGVNIR